MMEFNGMPVYVYPFIGPEYTLQQFRFHKSKKKRIRDKWKKQGCNLKTSTQSRFLVYDGKIFVDQETFDKIKDDHSSKDNSKGIL